MFIVAAVTIVVSASITRQGSPRNAATHDCLDHGAIPDAAVDPSGLLPVAGGGLCNRRPIR